MDIESECFPCIPMSSAIQLNAASLIGNHHLSNSNTTLTSSPSSSISSINSLYNSSLSSSIATTNSQSTNDAQFSLTNSSTGAAQHRRGRKGTNCKSKAQQTTANIIVTNCNNRQATKLQTDSATKNSALTALLNCSPLISANSSKTTSSHCLPPTPPASNSDSDCERDQPQSNANSSSEKTNLNKLSRQTNNQNNQNNESNQSSKQVKRQRANCSILVQSGNSVINLTQQLSPNSIKNLTSVNNLTSNSNSNTLDLTAGTYSPTQSNYLINGSNLKLDTSTNCINSSSVNGLSAANRNRSGLQSMSTLISIQPKNAASGTAVILTEEEKRTLIAEGKLMKENETFQLFDYITSLSNYCPPLRHQATQYQTNFH